MLSPASASTSSAVKSDTNSHHSSPGYCTSHNNNSLNNNNNDDTNGFTLMKSSPSPTSEGEAAPSLSSPYDIVNNAVSLSGDFMVPPTSPYVNAMSNVPRQYQNSPAQEFVYDDLSPYGTISSPHQSGFGGNGDIPNDPGKMFIGGLSWQTTPESIREYFSNFGELAEVMVMKDPATRRSRGFGFITFSDPASVEKVLRYPVHQLDGKVVEPKVAIPRKTNPKLVLRTKKIFVGGLSATTSLEDVREYFEQFSKVKDAMLAYDKVTNRHRGFGFVTFDNDEVVDKICEIHFHEIKGKMVESKKAMPKETRGVYGSPYYQPHYYNGLSIAMQPSSTYSPSARHFPGLSYPL